MGQIQKEGVPELKAVTELTSEILKITGEINILEQNNLNKAKTLLDDLGHEIKKLNQARKTNNVYSLNNKSTQGYFIDSKK